jgi:excisionase family DNA binding protein
MKVTVEIADADIQHAIERLADLLRSAGEERQEESDYDLLTVREAAALLRISHGKLYQLLLRDEIESMLLGRSRRIPRRAIKAFIDGATLPTTQAARVRGQASTNSLLFATRPEPRLQPSSTAVGSPRVLRTDR